jgi:glycosyltransferase involved in cell wall biosynthesis
MAGKILIVTDLDMKRLESSTEFNLLFLKECNQKNIAVEFVIPTNPCNLVKEKLEGVKFVYTVIENWWNKRNYLKRNNLCVAVKIFRLIKAKKPNLVVFNFCSAVTIFVIYVLLKVTSLRRPYLILLQQSEVRMNDSVYLFRKTKENFSKLRVLSWFVDAICPVSEAIKKQLIAKKINEAKIFVLYIGVNPDQFNRQVNLNELFSDLQLAEDAPIICTVSTLIEEKGYEYLLRAIKVVKTDIPSAKFIIIGEGPFLQRMRELGEELGISENIYFAGKRSDVPVILCSVDFLVHPSLREALPFTILEAMSARKAVIATSIGGIPELVKNGLNGILVPPRDYTALSDAILKLIRDKELCKSLGANGRIMVEKKFKIEKIIKDYFFLYESFLNKNSIKKAC